MHLQDDPPLPQEPPLHYNPLPPPRFRPLKPKPTTIRHSTTPSHSTPNPTGPQTEHNPVAQVVGNSTNTCSADLTSLRSSVTVVEDDSPNSPVTKDVNALPPSCSTSLTALTLGRSLDEPCLVKDSSAPRAPNGPPRLTLTLNTSCSMLRPANPFPTRDESPPNETDILLDVPISPAVSAVLQRFDVAEPGTLNLDDGDRRSLISSFLDIYLQLHESEQDEERSLRSSFHFPPSTEKIDAEIAPNLDPPGRRSTENEVALGPRPASQIAPRRHRPQNLSLHLDAEFSGKNSPHIPKSAPGRFLRPLPPPPSARNIRPLPRPPMPHANTAPAISIRTSFASVSSNSPARRSPLPTPPTNTRPPATRSLSLSSTLTTSSSFIDTPATTPSDDLHEPPASSRRPLLSRLQISQRPPEILTPLPPDIPIPPSPMTAKRHQASKLRRFLGEDVPPELVFGSKKDLVVGDMRRLSARLRARTERPQAMYLEAESVYSGDGRSSINPKSGIIEEEREDEDVSLMFVSDDREESEGSEESDSDRELDDVEEGRIDYAQANVINYQMASRVKRTSRLWVLERSGSRQNQDPAAIIQALRRL